MTNYKKGVLFQGDENHFCIRFIFLSSVNVFSFRSSTLLYFLFLAFVDRANEEEALSTSSPFHTNF